MLLMIHDCSFSQLFAKYAEWRGNENDDNTAGINEPHSPVKKAFILQRNCYDFEVDWFNKR